jgi:hypothetical protein
LLLFPEFAASTLREPSRLMTFVAALAREHEQQHQPDEKGLWGS